MPVWGIILILLFGIIVFTVAVVKMMPSELSPEQQARRDALLAQQQKLPDSPKPQVACPPGYEPNVVDVGDKCFASPLDTCGEDCAKSACVSYDGTWVPASGTYSCQMTRVRPDTFKLRQTNIADCGYAAGTRGWYDYSRQGVKNDYCRWVGGTGPSTSQGGWFDCAMAGTTKPYLLGSKPINAASQLGSGAPHDPIIQGDFCFGK